MITIRTAEQGREYDKIIKAFDYVGGNIQVGFETVAKYTTFSVDQVRSWYCDEAKINADFFKARAEAIANILNT